MDEMKKDCGCPPPANEEAAPLCCSQNAYPFTEEEAAIHGRLLAIKEEARALKERAASGEVPAAECEARLSALRAEWDRLKKEGEEAARRRMIALGHF